MVRQVLGPVTYLVETTQGHQWKRHTDQIKSVLNPTSATEEATEFPLEGTIHMYSDQTDSTGGVENLRQNRKMKHPQLNSQIGIILREIVDLPIVMNLPLEN